MSSKARHRTKTKTRVRDWDKTSNGYREKARQSLVSSNETYIPTSSKKLFSTTTLWDNPVPISTRTLARLRPYPQQVKKQTRGNGIIIPELLSTPLQERMDRSKQSVCEIRQQRKEIMFATNKAGRTGQKQKTYTALSKIKCK